MVLPGILVHFCGRGYHTGYSHFIVRPFPIGSGLYGVCRFTPRSLSYPRKIPGFAQNLKKTCDLGLDCKGLTIAQGRPIVDPYMR